MQPTYYDSASACDEKGGDQNVNRHTDRHTDRKVKTEGPRIMNVDIRFLHTVDIGGPI